MKHFEIKEEVKQALSEHKPIVALESTIIAHGMPYPQNLETAINVEDIIRNEGAVPATIAILEGKIKIGLTEEELNQIAGRDKVEKVSRRDLAYVIANKQYGATTVAATMFCAAAAGIKFFVTGGLGGVHRDYLETMDVSADLEELSKTNVTVVCAGVKAILDLPRTVEFLETKGVPIIGFGTDELPAFYTRSSGIKLRYKSDSPKQVSAIVKAKEDLGLEGGILVVNPIPAEFEMEKSFIDQIINESIEKATNLGVNGKDVTPFLLQQIVDATSGLSLKSNIQLVYNNAKVGSQIALAYMKGRQ
jgi:pseudouridine-5'-phosphate glycosidase